MQRHFSNRGEALAEVTAARMLARRIRPAEPASATQRGRQAKAAQWFTQVNRLGRRQLNTQNTTQTSHRCCSTFRGRARQEDQVWNYR